MFFITSCIRNTKNNETVVNSNGVVTIENKEIVEVIKKYIEFRKQDTTFYKSYQLIEEEKNLGDLSLIITATHLQYNFTRLYPRGFLVLNEDTIYYYKGIYLSSDTNSVFYKNMVKTKSKLSKDFIAKKKFYVHVCDYPSWRITVNQNKIIIDKAVKSPFDSIPLKAKEVDFVPLQ
jgi:hypothetical protein